MIREWLRKREEHLKKKDYYSGFGWAMSIYYLDNAQPDDILSCVTGHDDDDMFDKGAEKAVAILKLNEYNKK